jgi:hypothetical protein
LVELKGGKSTSCGERAGKKIQMMMDGSLWKGFCSGNKRVGDTVSACLDESCYGLGENAASFGGIFVALNILFPTF